MIRRARDGTGRTRLVDGRRTPLPRRRGVAPIGWAALATMALAAGGPGGDDAAWTLVLARVNGHAITLGEIRESFATRHEGHASLLVGEDIIQQVVEKAIDERLLIQEGERMGIPEEPGFDHARARYHDAIQLEEYKRRRIDGPAGATDEEVQAAYARLPRRLRIRMIETRTEMEAREARLRITLGESFDDVARLLSIDRTRTRGGDLGWVSWGMLDEATERAALAMSPGDLSAPVPVGERFRLLSLVEEQTADPPPLDQVRERLQAIIRQRKQEGIRSEVLAGIRAAHPPVIHEAAVASLLAPAPGDAGQAEPGAEAVLMTTEAGIAITAGQVRLAAVNARLPIATAWASARDDALLLDDARRTLGGDAAIENRAALYGDSLIRAKVEQVILAGLAISEEAVRASYEESPAAFSGPASFHMLHIVVATEPEARGVARRLEAGEAFEPLARELSIDSQTAARGGDLGWIEGPPGGPAARTGVFALAPGATSGVIRSDLGWSIVRMIEVREAPIPAWQDCKEEAAKRYLGRERRRLRSLFIARLREAADIEILEGAVPRAVRIQDEVVARRMGGPAS